MTNEKAATLARLNGQQPIMDHHEDGLTKREWMAALMMAGFCASGPHDCSLREQTIDAVRCADLLLETLEVLKGEADGNA